MGQAGMSYITSLMWPFCRCGVSVNSTTRELFGVTIRNVIMCDSALNVQVVVKIDKISLHFSHEHRFGGHLFFSR